MFYHIIVYKHEKDMLRMLDVELFQNRILEVMLPDFRAQSASEKEAILREYLKTVADNYDAAEIALQDKEGYFNAGVAYGKLEPAQEEDDDMWKRKKKKKDQVFNDFYKFQRRSANDRKAISKKKPDSDDEEDGEFEDVHDPMEDVEASEDDVPENGLEDPEYLKKRKQALASSFQEQLAALNKKKVKTM